MVRKKWKGHSFHYSKKASREEVADHLETPNYWMAGLRDASHAGSDQIVPVSFEHAPQRLIADSSGFGHAADAHWPAQMVSVL